MVARASGIGAVPGEVAAVWQQISRTKKLVTALVFGIVMIGTSQPTLEGEAAALDQAVACKPPTCLKISLFGYRMSPKVMRVNVPVADGTATGQFPAGTTVTLSWVNGDRVAHSIQSLIARDTDAVILGNRNIESGDVTCDAGGGCFDYQSGSVAARAATTRLTDKNRPAGSESSSVTFAKPGTYSFRCKIHGGMFQTLVIRAVKRV
jgi:plastocyanin